MAANLQGKLNTQGFGQKEFAARCFLFEMLSGYPTRKAPIGIRIKTLETSSGQGSGNFPFMLTPSLAVAPGTKRQPGF